MARIAANMAALTVLRAVEREGRAATAGEQRVLARWGGWGAQGVWQVFDEDRPELESERARLRELLSPAEFAAARLTTINAHYTDPSVVAQVWSAVEQLGFDGGRVLEPGCGSGTFIGYAPAGAVMTGVELDPTTAAIAGLLYPQASILAESFAETRFPPGHFDAAVGNVPFANVRLHDPRYNPAGLRMHNHFLVKSLQLVRPGGLVAALTSRWTMDATTPAARAAIGDLADLVTAVRLPSKTHWRIAGTEAVTDLLILRRRELERPPADMDWLSTTKLDLAGPRGEMESIDVNAYWMSHPEHVLGEPILEVGMHGIAGLSIRATEPLERVGEQLGARLQADVAAAGEAGLVMVARTEQQQLQVAGWAPAAAGAVDGQLVARRDGTFAVVEDGAEVAIDIPKTQAAEVRSLLELCDHARSLIAAEAESLEDSPELDGARQRLATLWRSYVNRYGPINRFTVRNTGRIDEDTGEQIVARLTPPAVRRVTRSTFGTLVSALEVFDDLAQTAQPTSLLQHRLIVPREPVQHVESAADGLAVVLDTMGRVDIGRIAELMGVEAEQAIAELGDQVFQVPGTDQWQTRAHYLSGDVRAKLDQAAAAEAAEPGRWAAQVAALQAVLPEPVGPGDIGVRLGAVWIPDVDHQQFLAELLHDRHGQVEVTHLTGSQWEVKAPTWGVEANSEWGTRRIPAPRLMEALMAQRPIVVFDTLDDGKRVPNPTETEAAQEKARLLQERFAEWLWEDPERTSRLLTEYNRRFNSLVLRDYSAEGARLTLPGLAHSFTPRNHQRTAVARMINEPCVGLFHEVGAGKTAEMIMGVTELRRLGLIRKPAIVVPNNMLVQFATDWLQLYPQAKILAASTDELTAQNRRRFVAQVASNDWDGIVMTRTAFERLSLTPDNEANYQDRQLEQVRQALVRVKEAKGDTAGVKRLEKAMLRAEEKLKELRAGPTDPDLHFEYTGIDYLVVDEMHQYKNLATVSSIPDANIAGSKRATDLHAKVDYLRQTTGERVFTGATATPLANSITELYVVQRYLDPDSLIRAGLTDFDSWAATFGEVVTGPELSVAGGGRFKVKNRFARFTNVPELLAMFHSFADVKTAADLDLPTPAIQRRPDGQHAPKIIVVPPGDELLAYFKTLGERTDSLSYGGDDNMLLICTDGRKAALSMQLINPASRDNGKIDTAADELARVWEATKDNRYLDPDTGEESPIPGALQIVFCDFGTPGPRWNAYHALRDALAARGLPPGSVRFIHDANTDADKAKLFAACRSGHVAVIIGSTDKMGIGTNIQHRAVHLMDLDAPWRPADVAQRHGRILRQGNQNPEIAITQLVTEQSFDAYMWQTLERKATFIEQIMSGRGVDRSTGDIGEATLNAAEGKALSSGNPLLLDMALAEQDLARFTRLERAHATTQRSLGATLEHSQRGLENTRHRIERLTKLDTRSRPTSGQQFAFTHARSGNIDRDRASTASHLDRALMGLQETPVHVGSLGGHQLAASARFRYDSRGSRWRDTTWNIIGDDDLKITTSWRVGGEGRPVEVGTIVRLEHLVASIPTAIAAATEHAANLEHTIQQAQRLHGQPFKFSGELAETRVRYSRLTAQLAAMQTSQDPAWEVVTAPPRRTDDERPSATPGFGRRGPQI